MDTRTNDVAETGMSRRRPPSLRQAIHEYFTRRRTWVDRNGFLWVAHGPAWLSWCCEHWLATVAAVAAFLVGRLTA